MRDAGPQGRQERGARRNRHLAGRSNDLIDDVLRLAAAIVVDAAAFMFWNLAARSPRRLTRDLASGLSRPGTALRGLARFGGGLVFFAGGATLLIPLSIETRTFLVLETWTLLTALLVEALLGWGRPAGEA